MYGVEQFQLVGNLKSRILQFILVLLAGIGVAACQPSDSVGELSATPAASPSATDNPTSYPTKTPAPTSTITRTPYPPTPESQIAPNIFDRPIADNLLFSGDENCKLPCWYGLRIGESSFDQIQVALKQAIGLPDKYFLNMGRSAFPSKNDYVSFNWEQNGLEGSTEFLSIGAYFDPSTDLLRELFISVSHPLYMNRTKPQHVLQELGIPSRVSVEFSITEVIEIASLQVDFLYFDNEQWMHLFWITRIPVEVQQSGNMSRIAKWCLNGSYNQDDDYFLLEIPPELDPEKPANYVASLQTVFDISPEELYERAINENNTCLTHEF